MAVKIEYIQEGDAELMSNATLNRLIGYLKSVGWSDAQIIGLLDYITSK